MLLDRKEKQSPFAKTRESEKGKERKLKRKEKKKKCSFIVNIEESLRDP